MPYKRFSLVAETFSIPQNHAVFVDIDFFNSHSCYRKQAHASPIRDTRDWTHSICGCSYGCVGLVVSPVSVRLCACKHAVLVKYRPARQDQGIVTAVTARTQESLHHDDARLTGKAPSHETSSA